MDPDIVVISGSGAAPDSDEGRGIFASFFGLASDELKFFRHSTPPGEPTERHVHTAAVSAYVVKGSMEVGWGPNFEMKTRLEPGDYLYIPEWLAHEECVIGDEEVEFLVAHLRGFHTLASGD